MFLYLPSHSETKPTQEEESMPPTEKMATDRDHREVRVPEGMGFPYRYTHVALYSSSMICREIHFSFKNRMQVQSSRLQLRCNYFKVMGNFKVHTTQLP